MTKAQRKLNNQIMKTIVWREPVLGTVNFVFQRETRRGPRASGVAYAQELEFKDRPPEDEGLNVQPAFTLRMEEAQRLMDQLWDCGLRPTEGTGSAGAMAATQRHLEDMRKLVQQVLPCALQKEGKV